MRTRNVIGKVYLFPLPNRPGKPWTKDHANKLHRRAQWHGGAGHRLTDGNHGECVRCDAEIDARGPNHYRLYTNCAGAPVPYIGFHAYRRKWVTERKDRPRKDVAAAGGWKSIRTLDIYEQPDEETVFSVVSEPRKLRNLG